MKFRRIEIGLIGALITNQPTLALSNLYRRSNGQYVNASLVVQVVPTGVYLFEWDPSLGGHIERDKWCLPQGDDIEIVSASINSSQVSLASSRGDIVLLRIENNATKLEKPSSVYTSQNRIRFLCFYFRPIIHSKSQISAMSLSLLNPQAAFSNRLLVAYWKTNVVEIFDIGKELQSRVCSPALPSLVRSILLYNFGSDKNSKGLDYHPYLLAGLGDGSVATMSFKGGQLKDLKIISLGHAPVQLTPCVVEGRQSVFAAGYRSTVFFVDKGRLVNSPIMLKVTVILYLRSVL